MINSGIIQSDLALRIDQLQQENEILRRGFKGDYCLDSWLEFVKEKEQLQNKLAESEARVGRLEKAALIAIHAMSGGEAKAEVRDIYDETKSQSLQHIQAEAALEMASYLYKNGYTNNLAMVAAREHLAELRQQQTNGSDGDE